GQGPQARQLPRTAGGNRPGDYSRAGDSHVLERRDDLDPARDRAGIGGRSVVLLSPRETGGGQGSHGPGIERRRRLPQPGPGNRGGHLALAGGPARNLRQTPGRGTLAVRRPDPDDREAGRSRAVSPGRGQSVSEDPGRPGHAWLIDEDSSDETAWARR